MKEDGEVLNEDIFLLNSLTKACKYKNDKIYHRFPIRHGLLSLLLKGIDDTFMSQSYLCTLHRALFTTAYFGLFRVGELMESDHVVKAVDVHVDQNKKKFMCILHTSKTHWMNEEPQVIKVHSLAKDIKDKKHGPAISKSFCPFTELQEYIQRRRSRRNDAEHFFIFRDRSVVKPSHFRYTLKKVLLQLKLDPAFYNSHSFHIG